MFFLLISRARRSATPPRHAREPVTGVFGRIGTQPDPRLGVGIVWGLRQRQAAIGRSGEPNGLARRPLRHAQRLPEHVGGAAPGSWAQNSPVMTVVNADPTA